MFIGKVVFICRVGSVSLVLKFVGQPGETRFYWVSPKFHRGSPWLSILSWLNLKANKDYFFYECIYICMLMCVYMSTHTRAHIHTHAHTHAHTHNLVCIHTHIYILMYVYMSTHTRAHIHTRTHTHAHTHNLVCIHTHIYTWGGYD